MKRGLILAVVALFLAVQSGCERWQAAAGGYLLGRNSSPVYVVMSGF